METPLVWWRKLLDFLRLTDDTGVLSLTNITLIVVLVKVALTKNVTLTDLGAMLVTLMQYTGTKVLAHVVERAEAADVTAAHVEALDAVAGSVKKLEERALKQDNLSAVNNAMGRGR